MTRANRVLTEKEKIELLKKCVTVKTDTRLRNRLRYAGFYRLRIYTRFLLSKSHILKSKPSEDLLYNLYDLDEKLRLLLFVFCKKAEIRLKASVSSVCTQKEGTPLFYTLRTSYTPSKSNNDKLEKQNNIKYFEVFLKDLQGKSGTLRMENYTEGEKMVVFEMDEAGS